MALSDSAWFPYAQDLRCARSRRVRLEGNHGFMQCFLSFRIELLQPGEGFLPQIAEWAEDVVELRETAISVIMLRSEGQTFRGPKSFASFLAAVFCRDSKEWRD